MSEHNEPPELSSAPTQLGPDEEFDDWNWSPRVDLSPGTMLGERYRIESCIGIGGMATVFEARDLELDKSVAVKVLGEELARKPGLVKRFLQEARAASLIRHPHIVEIIDFGYVREDLPYYVMEHLQGESLASRLKRAGKLPWPQARHITVQLCTALEAAHGGGVVHRDMKPDNVFLVEREGDPDFVKILDFGIAKVLNDSGDKGLTRTGVIMGTAAYMAPEQAKGRGIDARADVYATGIILYEMLAGRVPFDGDAIVEVLTKHLIEPVPPLRPLAPGVTPAVERLVQKALQKDQEERYGSASALARALEDLGDGGGEVPRGLRLAALSALAAVAVGLTALAVWAWPTDEPTSPAPIAAPKPQIPPPPSSSPPDADPAPSKPAPDRRSRPSLRPKKFGKLPTVPNDSPSELPSVGSLPSVDDPEPTSAGAVVTEAAEAEAAEAGAAEAGAVEAEPAAAESSSTGMSSSEG